MKEHRRHKGPVDGTAVLGPPAPLPVPSSPGYRRCRRYPVLHQRAAVRILAAHPPDPRRRARPRQRLLARIARGRTLSHPLAAGSPMRKSTCSRARGRRRAARRPSRIIRVDALRGRRRALQAITSGIIAHPVRPTYAPTTSITAPQEPNMDQKSNISVTVENYFEMWNARDARTRRTLVEEVWTEQA